MIYKFRIILDTEQDVFRDIEISGDSYLIDLHQAIKDSFELPGDEMASFFLSNDEWFQGSEIPMEDMSGDEQAEIMSNTKIGSVVNNIGGRVIYLYDFLAMWTFFCEVVEKKQRSKHELPYVSYSYGTRPENAPENDSMHFTLEDEFMEEEDEEEDPYSFY